MNTLVGSVVRLEPLAIHHIPDLFDALGNDEEAWQWMLAKTPTTLAEMGSTIYSRQYWRTAVNTESKLLLLTEAFEVQDYLRVALKTDSENKRSQAAIKRIGGKFEGVLRAHKIRIDGSSRDTVYFSILQSEWPEVKVSLQKALA